MHTVSSGEQFNTFLE